MSLQDIFERLGVEKDKNGPDAQQWRLQLSYLEIYQVSRESSGQVDVLFHHLLPHQGACLFTRVVPVPTPPVQEDVNDLLRFSGPDQDGSNAKAPQDAPLSVRENAQGGVTVAGLTLHEVSFAVTI